MSELETIMARLAETQPAMDSSSDEADVSTKAAAPSEASLYSDAEEGPLTSILDVASAAAAPSAATLAQEKEEEDMAAAAQQLERLVLEHDGEQADLDAQVQQVRALLSQADEEADMSARVQQVQALLDQKEMDERRSKYASMKAERARLVQERDDIAASGFKRNPALDDLMAEWGAEEDEDEDMFSSGCNSRARYSHGRKHRTPHHSGRHSKGRYYDDDDEQEDKSTMGRMEAKAAAMIHHFAV